MSKRKRKLDQAGQDESPSKDLSANMRDDSVQEPSTLLETLAKDLESLMKIIN